MRTLFLTFAAALLLLPSDAVAETFADPRNGIVLDLPSGYRVHSELQPGEPPSSLIVILGDTGHPFVPGANTPVCAITQAPEPDFVGRTQQDINADATNWPADIIAELMGAAALSSAKPFEHDGLIGIEVVTRLTQSQTNEAYLVFFTFGTPGFRTAMSCATAEETLQLALPVYRRFRDGIVIPR